MADIQAIENITYAADEAEGNKKAIIRIIDGYGGDAGRYFLIHSDFHTENLLLDG